jgi:hypothetical protein
LVLYYEPDVSLSVKQKIKDVLESFGYQISCFLHVRKESLSDASDKHVEIDIEANA